MVKQQHYDKLKQGVDAWNKWRKEHPEIFPDLRDADIHGMLLNGVNFRHTNLDGANLRNANLCSALLDHASFYQTDLSGANLRNAVLHKTCFKETILRQANFHNAYLSDTLFLRVDLSETINIENALHRGPSTIGIDTIQHSKGKIPNAFLSNAGVSKQLLVSIHESGIAPFDYYTCFVSHSHKDQHFVDILYRDLCKEGVLCWYAPESLKGGDRFPMYVTEEVQGREKVLVVVSKSSLKSDWVAREVKLALQKEQNGKDVLVLIMLNNNAVEHSKVDWAVKIHAGRHMVNFENWQQSSNYQKMFKDLLKALRKPQNNVAKRT